MTDYSDWKILKSDLPEKQEEYSEVAEWCNENQEYHIEEKGKHYIVVKNPLITKEEKDKLARDKRNYYLTQYVDPYVTNPLRWADMSEEEQEDIAGYRRYLLDITESKDFPDIEIMTFDDWQKTIDF